MRWGDTVLLALRGIRRRPARTLLTMAAVALGSGLLTALATIAQVADSRIVAQLGKGGPATAIRVAAAAPDLTAPDTDQLKTSAPRDLDQAALDRIAASPGVRAEVPVLAVPIVVVPPPRGAAAAADPNAPDPFADTAVGVDLAGSANLPVTLLAGRLPATGSILEVAVTLGYLDHIHRDIAHPEAVLGSEVQLGGPQVEPPRGRGQSVRLRWSRATITGVVAQEVADGDVLTDLRLTQTLRAWALEGVASGRFPMPTSPYSGAVVVATDLSAIHDVRTRITGLGYATSAPEHLVTTVQKYLHVVDIVLGAIGVIALIIAALGITDALLAAVRERLREIGVLKAIGARDSDVLRWFMAEALIVGAAGGLVGSGLGIVVARIVGSVVNDYLVGQGLMGVDPGPIPLPVLGLGIAGSALLALIAAAGPALRAARLPAREAVNAP